MKKFVSLILSTAIVCAGFSVSPNAATMDSQAGRVSVSSGRLNVRSNGTLGAPVISSLNKGSYVTLIKKFGSWWLVEYGDGRYGYCHSDYIKADSDKTKTVNVGYGTLNVRSGPGIGYDKKDSLLKGETVIVLSASNGWSKILYHGTKTGYVSSQYLSSTSQTGTNAVKLNVVSFKQDDQRWGGVKIGSSGKTMAQIGCVTTGLAMLESYRTGSIIYPDTMAKRLNYSSSGDVYWPSHLNVVTNSSGYLQGIYQQLKNGKPVLLGAKNSRGGQHWVVVTGYVGSGSLSASDFVINDPGSNTRTRLSQFLSVYPNFYKYFYY